LDRNRVTLADPRFQEFTRLADLRQPEDPLVYSGQVLHAVRPARTSGTQNLLLSAAPQTNSHSPGWTIGNWFSVRWLGAACRPMANLAHQQLVGAEGGNDGQAAITRLAAVSCATATLAARLAALPTTSSAQGSTRPVPPHANRPAMWSTPPRSSRPQTGASAPPPSRAARATPPAGAYEGGKPSRRSAPQAHAPGRGPPDPPIRTAGHDRPSTAKAPASTHWDLGALAPRTPDDHGMTLAFTVFPVTRAG
jgi:hypothetical protein